MYSQPGIFNVLDGWGGLGYGMKAGDPSRTAAKKNSQALAATVNAALDYCNSTGFGAIVLIPSNSEVPPLMGGGGNGGIYYLSAQDLSGDPLVTINCALGCPLKIMGTSNASRLSMLASDANVDDEVPMFYIDNGGSDDVDVGGITFEDLWFEYDKSLGGASSAVMSVNSQNVRLNRCVLVNVSNGVVIQNTSQFSMTGCTGLFDASVGGTMLTIGDTGSAGTGSFYAYVANCQFRVGTGEETGTSAALGLVLGICNELRVVDCHFDGFNTGITFSPSANTTDMSFTNVTLVGQGTQISMTPSDTNKIQGVCFTNCNFQNNSASGSAGATLSAVVLDAGTNPTIDGVRFVSCLCLNNAAAGLELRKGQNIEILGGLYSANSQLTVGLTGSAAIWLNGTGTNLRIVGASLVPGAFSATNPQPYGVNIGGWTNVLINNCDVTGYNTLDAIAPFLFSSPGTGLQIVNCAGYNDQGKSLALTFLPGSATFSSDGLGYYGPVVFYISGTHVTEVQINSVNTGLTSGTSLLPAGSATTIKITYSATPTVTAIGM
jgi:hypothetical protein